MIISSLAAKLDAFQGKRFPTVGNSVRPGQPIAEDRYFALRIADPQGALADEAPKQIRQ